MGVEAMGQPRDHAGEDRADGASLLKMRLLLIHTVVHTVGHEEIGSIYEQMKSKTLDLVARGSADQRGWMDVEAGGMQYSRKSPPEVLRECREPRKNGKSP
jgi:hypothetical protein